MSGALSQAMTTSHDLGSGLRLRWATAADRERLADFNAHAFRDGEADPPQSSYRAGVLEMMSGRHPLIGPEDFAYVEDTATGAMVSSACLLRQRWEYEGIPFAVGRPEFVATDAAYRNRGLIRALFAALHERSAARGELAQGITGIPYFYRQFGYEYALDLEGGRAALPATIPALAVGEQEPYILRAATAADLPLIAALYDRERAGYAVSASVPDEYWRYALLPFATSEHPGGEFDRKWWLRVIVDRAGAVCGYVRTGTTLWGDTLYVWDLAVAGGCRSAPPRSRSCARSSPPGRNWSVPLMPSISRTHSSSESCSTSAANTRSTSRLARRSRRSSARPTPGTCASPISPPS